MTREPVFASNEVATIWGYLRGTVAGMVEIAADLSTADLQWTPPAPDTNSIGVLLVHTLGNIEENILTVVSGQPGNRVREAEFVGNELTGVQLAERWEALSRRLVTALAAIADDQLETIHNHPRRGEITTRAVLLQATVHAAEHLGHVGLTRDLLRADRPV